MGKKLYVGNLPYSMDEQKLNETFSPFGTVESVRIITDRETGRSKGFGFVEMSSDDEASEAIKNLNGAELDGRNIRVDEATERPRGGGGGGGGRGGFGGRRGGGGRGGRY